MELLKYCSCVYLHTCNKRYIKYDIACYTFSDKLFSMQVTHVNSLYVIVTTSNLYSVTIMIEGMHEPLKGNGKYKQSMLFCL